MRTTPRLWLLSLPVLLLSACALGTQVKQTRLNFQHPAGPFLGGYVVDLSSKSYTAKLMCSFAQGGTQGRVLDMDPKSNGQPMGVCDDESMTIDVGLKEEITLTLTLGGYPFLDRVSKHPTRFVDLTGADACLGCKAAVFDFAFDVRPR